MKYVKMLGVLAVAAAALMAFVGTASATVTSPAGTKFTGTLKATSTNTSLDGSVKISCGHSSVEGTVTNGSTSGPITALTFTSCGSDTVNVVSKGTIEINNATNVVKSTGAEVTVQLHRSIFGFPITTHCIYRTNGTSVGTLTEGAAPALHIGSSPIPEVETDSACGNDAVWTGSYTVNQPKPLIVD